MSPARHAILAALLAAAPLALAVLPTAAQSGRNDGTVTCSSDDNRRQQCATPFRGRATLVKNLSDTRCVEGRNWGSGNGSIWVSGGCRGEFAEGRGGWGGDNGHGNGNYSVTCSSDDGRRRTCAWDSRQGRPTVIKQLSDTPCAEGRNWGYYGGTVWVNAGCRAQFGAR